MRFNFSTFHWETGYSATSALGEGDLAPAPVRLSQVSGHRQTAVEIPAGKFCDGGNSKLGKGLMSFDMSPIVSCPGSKHAICRELRPDGKADPKPICWGR